MDRSIYCCIVDNHCDVTPFLHACWKAKKIAFTDLLLVHIDAHPDLMMPQANVNDFSNCDLLYDILEGTGGISEFILPLVYNGHFSQGILWMRPEWSNQFGDGLYKFNVGNNENNIGCVDLLHPYYLDEGIVYDTNDIHDSVPVSLISTTISSLENNISHLAHKTKSITPTAIIDSNNSRTKWVLDICLDYFTTTNPFLTLLEQRLNAICNNDISNTWSINTQEIITITSNMYYNVAFRNVPDVRNNTLSTTAVESNAGDSSKCRYQRNEFIEILNSIYEIYLNRDINLISMHSPLNPFELEFLNMFVNNKYDNNENSALLPIDTNISLHQLTSDTKLVNDWASVQCAAQFLKMLHSVPVDVIRLLSEV
jgi:hypothetical protein